MEAIDLTSENYGLQPLQHNNASTLAAGSLYLDDPFVEQTFSHDQFDAGFAMIDPDMEEPTKASQSQYPSYPQPPGNTNAGNSFSSWLPKGFSLPNRDRQHEQYPTSTPTGASKPSFHLPTSSHQGSRKRSHEVDLTDTSAPSFRLPSTITPNNGNRQYDFDITDINTDAPVAKKKKSKRRVAPAPTTSYAPTLPPTPVSSCNAQTPQYQHQPTQPYAAPQYVDISNIDNITNMAQSLTQMLNGQASVTGLLRDLATRVNDQDNTIRDLHRELNALRQHMDATFTSFAEQTTKANKALEEKCQEVIDARDEEDLLREVRPAGGAYGGPKFKAPVAKPPSMLQSMMPGAWGGNGATPR